MKTLIALQLFAATTVPTNLVQKAWAKQLWTEALKETYFNKFTGEGENSIIQTKTELKKDAGDKITVPLLMNLVGDGITGDNTLEGNEEALQFYDCPVEIDQIRHAVKLKGRFEEQKTQINLRTSAKNALKKWFSEKMEKMVVAALTTTPDADHVIYAGGVANKNAIAATNKMTADLISAAARKAKTATPKIRRPVVDGKEYYVMLVDPYQARDLKADTKWVEAQKFAAARGENNPIFTGMLGVYDGVIVHEYEYLPRANNTASTPVKCGTALLLGCQAGIRAVGKEAFWEEDTFDYHNQYGVATGAILGFQKSKFNSKDFATIQVITSSVDD